MRAVVEVSLACECSRARAKYDSSSASRLASWHHNPHPGLPSAAAGAGAGHPSRHKVAGHFSSHTQSRARCCLGSSDASTQASHHPKWQAASRYPSPYLPQRSPVLCCAYKPPALLPDACRPFPTHTILTPWSSSVHSSTNSLLQAITPLR